MTRNIQPSNTTNKRIKCQNSGKEPAIQQSTNIRNLPFQFGGQETKLTLKISFLNTIDYGLKVFLMCPFFCLSFVDIVQRPHAGFDEMFSIDLPLTFILLFAITIETFNVQYKILKEKRHVEHNHHCSFLISIGAMVIH